MSNNKKNKLSEKISNKLFYSKRDIYKDHLIENLILFAVENKIDIKIPQTLLNFYIIDFLIKYKRSKREKIKDIISRIPENEKQFFIEYYGRANEEYLYNFLNGDTQYILPEYNKENNFIDKSIIPFKRKYTNLQLNKMRRDFEAVKRGNGIKKADIKNSVIDSLKTAAQCEPLKFPLSDFFTVKDLIEKDIKYNFKLENLEYLTPEEFTELLKYNIKNIYIEYKARRNKLLKGNLNEKEKEE